MSFAISVLKFKSDKLEIKKGQEHLVDALIGIPANAKIIVAVGLNLLVELLQWLHL